MGFFQGIIFARINSIMGFKNIFMKTICSFYFVALALISCHNNNSESAASILPVSQPAPAKPSSTLPKPAHVLVVIMENHSFNQIFHSKNAPAFNALVTAPQSALFTQSYAVAHPSQPNYLALFSGDTQGSTDDEIPDNLPFTTPNLGRQLLDAGYTFAIYSEDLPEVGFNGKFAKIRKYARKHNPVPNWVGTGVNQIPASTNQPFTAFPANYDSLPTVCFVVPNQDNDMHDGTIAQADKWYAKNLESYRQWAAKHNSLLIVTFDEDDNSSSNRITTIFSGAHVKAGEDNMHITHYNVLRTIEDFYHLPYAGHAAEVATIDNCWN